MTLGWVSGIGVAAVVLLAGCEETAPSGVELAERSVETAKTTIDPSTCSPDAGGFSTTSTNPWFPMQVGDQWFYEGEDDGADVELLVTVLGQTRTIDGVTTRVVEEREWEDGELLEVSWNYIAQSGDGTICYFGEDVDIYEDEEISHEGAWCADEAPNAPGILMPADPKPGLKFPLEIAPGIAEDEAMIVGAGPTSVPAGVFTHPIRFRERNPLSGEVDYKIFAQDIGLIVDGPVELESFTQGASAPAGPIPTEQECGV